MASNLINVKMACDIAQPDLSQIAIDGVVAIERLPFPSGARCQALVLPEGVHEDGTAVAAALRLRVERRPIPGVGPGRCKGVKRPFEEVLGLVSISAFCCVIAREHCFVFSA